MDIRKARSSTQPARCGKTLLTQRPHWPCCLNSKGLLSTLKSAAELVTDSSLTLPPGVELLAVELCELGLVVEGVHRAGAAVHEQLDHAFDFPR